jgi:hypothetical protein
MEIAMFPHSFNPEYVRPLAKAENELLQVLVHRFRIERKGNGFELHVGFNDESPAIWRRGAKSHILDTLQAERRAALQGEIEAFFASNNEAYEHRDAAFPFRLGNGGTLPVVRLRGTDYYALFFRDSHPTGWNIANGGASTRYDLLHPDAIVERELREELIIVEPERGRWYVFDWHDARLRDHPDFAMAHAQWEERFRSQGFRGFDDVALPLKWSLPPDADRQAVEHRYHDAVRIRFGDDTPIYTGQGFLNINAEDFGIEFDRIAKLSVGPEAVFCDGELRSGLLLNRVVGLFALDHIHEQPGPFGEIMAALDAGKSLLAPSAASRARAWLDLKGTFEKYQRDPAAQQTGLKPVSGRKVWAFTEEVCKCLDRCFPFAQYEVFRKDHFKEFGTFVRQVAAAYQVGQLVPEKFDVYLIAYFRTDLHVMKRISNGRPAVWAWLQDHPVQTAAIIIGSVVLMGMARMLIFP